MDTASADPDTQTDVNLLILDYLLCLAIEAVLSKRISEREGHQSQRDAGWLVNSVNIINSILPQHQTQSLPPDLSTKLQLLAFACHFLLRYTHNTLDERPGNLLSLRQPEPEFAGTHGLHIESHTWTQTSRIKSLSNSLANYDPDIEDKRYKSTLNDLEINPNTAQPRKHLLPLSLLVPEFIALCTTASAAVPLPESSWFDIAVQLTALAFVEDIAVFGGAQFEEVYSRCLSWAPRDPDKARVWEQSREYYRSEFVSPFVSKNVVALPIFRLEGDVIDFLFDIMKSLEPPVLIQLERGKLGDLSRAETQALKDRIGLI
ncbi:hypothetical protein PHISP_05711 [Aspergillus sp. HF37]|nr:hypothetical protein PHISP_05711 [Aspergillus sp. HF37]